MTLPDDRWTRPLRDVAVDAGIDDRRRCAADGTLAERF
jgi:hypothetical protein